MPQSSNRELYSRFCTAVTAGDDQALRSMCSPSFTAELPGTGLMTVDHLVTELDRQRTAFPDLGQNVTVKHSAEQGNVLFVAYTMAVTHVGLLKGWHGVEARPTGKSITIQSVDMLVFEGGLISKLVVTSDRMETTNQLIA